MAVLRPDRFGKRFPREVVMPQAGRMMREGVVLGLIAYASVAVFYSGFDFLASRGTLYTVNMLGLAMFRGLRDPAVLQLPIPLDFTAIFWYNGFHFVSSLAIGLIVSRLIEQAERRPAQAHLILLIIVVGFALTVLGVGLLTGPMRPVLPWWSIALANALAALLAGSYLLQRHPGLLGRLSTSEA
jgi:hypothetical protein